MLTNHLHFAEVETEALEANFSNPGPLWVLNSRIILLDSGRRAPGPGRSILRLPLLPHSPGN
jgi:hypothetical protein